MKITVTIRSQTTEDIEYHDQVIHEFKQLGLKVMKSTIIHKEYTYTRMMIGEFNADVVIHVIKTVNALMKEVKT